MPLKPGEQPPRLAARGFAGGGHEMSLVASSPALRELGPRYVVVTDGRHGAFLGTPEAIMYCPVLETKVAGTAGAGDAFNATFTAYVAWAGPRRRRCGRRPSTPPRSSATSTRRPACLSREEIDGRLGER